ncbi:MAG: hypothetical protein ACT7A5_11105 [Ferrovibrionaceae bacterium]
MPNFTALAAMAVFLGFAALVAPDDNVRLAGDGLAPLTHAISTISPPAGRPAVVAAGE